MARKSMLISVLAVRLDSSPINKKRLNRRKNFYNLIANYISLNPIQTVWESQTTTVLEGAAYHYSLGG